MASFSYLWKNRAKYKPFSIAFFKSWAKRFFSLKEVFKRNLRRNSLNRKGALIEETAEIGHLEANGKKSNLKIGSFTFLGRVELALHEKITIGSYVCINDGVKILSASHDLNDPLWRHIKKEIIIDDYAWIATNAIILPGVHIGKGAVIGAGAVVSKSVTPYSVVAGNPAIPVKERCKEFNYNPCEFLAGNHAWLARP